MFETLNKLTEPQSQRRSAGTNQNVADEGWLAARDLGNRRPQAAPHPVSLRGGAERSGHPEANQQLIATLPKTQR